jgi:hypothetical protein
MISSKMCCKIADDVARFKKISADKQRATTQKSQTCPEVPRAGQTLLP